MRRPYRLVVVPLMVLLLVLLGSTAQADYAQIEGTGSTWSKVIFDQWIADVAPSGIKVAYSGVGSSAGRKDFAAPTTDFAISEIPYQGKDESGADDVSTREYSYMPIVAGGTAFTYHLEQGGKLLTGIRLSGETVAKIFTCTITSWADPQIAADNNGRVLPDTPVTPVVRSDGSGTTAQLTTWLDKVYPAIWRPYFGKAGLTSYYPKQACPKMIAAAGSDQVMNTISAATGNGQIGYVEYSYPLNKKYPVLKLLNAAGFYVEPTQYNVAVALTQAQINSDKSSLLYLTQVLDGVYANPDPRAYPLSSYSYMILPTGANDPRMTTAKRQSLADLMFYGLCEGQSEAGPYGYSPMPLNLVKAGFDQLAKLKVADPNVDLEGRDATKCHNPTFVAGNLAANHLADIAPQPAACDKTGAGPCGAAGAVGAAAGAAAGGNAAAGGTQAGAGGGAAAAGDDPAATGAASGDAVVQYDPITGEPVGSTSDTSATASGAVSTDVPSRPLGGGGFFGGLAAVELLAIILIPGLFALWSRRGRGAR